MRSFLTSLATVAMRHRRKALGGVAALSLAAALVAFFGPLDLDTSRRGLISSDDPRQAKLLEFIERFGPPDAVVFVIEGDSAAGRRAVASDLIDALEAMPGLADRVLGRLDMGLLAEVLALNHPDILDGLGGAASAQGPAGMTAIAKALADRIYAGLDGEDGALSIQDESQLSRMTPLILAFNAALGGDTATEGGWLGLAEGETLGGHSSLDSQGYLVGSDAKRHLVVVFPDFESDEAWAYASKVDAMRAVRDDVLARNAAAAPKVTVDVTGIPALAIDELRIVRHGTLMTSLLSVAGILLILLVAFRSLWTVVLALIPLGAGVVITLGLLELLYDGMNLVTSSFLPVLMGLGIDLGVHLIYRYQQGRREDLTPPGAMRAALIHAGPGVTTGAATTAIAFATVATTDFTAFAELGVITAAGLLVMLVCAFLLIPALAQVRGDGGDTFNGPPEFIGAHRAERLVRGGAPWILIGGVVLTVVGLAMFLPRGPGYHNRYFDFLPKETESYRGLNALEDDRMIGPAVVNLSTTSLPEARSLAAAIAQLDEVGTVHSPTDVFPPLDDARLAALRAKVASLPVDAEARLIPPEEPVDVDALIEATVALQDALDEVAFALKGAGRDTAVAAEAANALKQLRATLMTLDADGTATLAELQRDVIDVARRAVVSARAVADRGRYDVSDLPPLFRHRYVSKDGEGHVAVFAYPSGNIWEDEFARRFTAAIDSVHPEASGLALDIYRHNQLITDGFLRAALYAAVLVALMLLLVFRHLGHAALAMFPVVVGWAWMLGLMKPLGMQFDVANLVALPLIFGIGVDAGAHMVHRYREALAEGRKTIELGELVRGTGAAVMVSALTTMVGFAALIAGEYHAMKSLGTMLVIGIGTSLVASVLVLPALLVVLRRAR